jgi:hypothetical protein
VVLLYKIQHGNGSCPTARHPIRGFWNAQHGSQRRKDKGEEGSEGETTRTDLYMTEGNVWLGEIVTRNGKQTFHIFLKIVRGIKGLGLCIIR